MPRFDIRVEFPGTSGDRETFHTIGTAADLESLPTACAASLAKRIIEQCGVVPEGPANPEDEKRYADAIEVLERSSGPVDHATKNAMRKAWGLAPVSRKEAKEEASAKKSVK